MSTLAEAAFQAGGEQHTGLPKLVAQTIGGGQGLLPALTAFAFDQISLAGLCVKLCGMHTEQTHLSSLTPILAEQGSDLGKDFGVELRGMRQGVGAGDGGEILVAQ